MLLAASAGVNVLQEARIRALTSGQAVKNIGRRPAALEGYALTGSPLKISLRTTVPTVIYFFSSACGWCERNWNNIAALDRAAGGRYRVIAVSSERGLREYLESRHVGVDVIEGINENTRRDFGFSGTPHTLVVSSDGLVTHEWRGAYTPRIERQIEDLFDIGLPGLAAK